MKDKKDNFINTRWQEYDFNFIEDRRKQLGLNKTEYLKRLVDFDRERAEKAKAESTL